MSIDFNKLVKKTDKNVIDTTKIFDILPGKNEKYDGYLREVQSEVLKEWFLKSRDKKDSIIKMNTGSGKTVVGLLILQSYINEGYGPCVYVVPDNYLLEQVKLEAQHLNIKYAGYKQGTVSSWVTRNRSVKAIPCDFLYSLSLAASLPMDHVYKDLLQLEEQFLLSNSYSI